MLRVLNPETGMLPNITSNEELDFLCSVYNNNPTFGNEYTGCRFGRLVHLTNHSQHILREKKWAIYLFMKESLLNFIREIMLHSRV